MTVIVISLVDTEVSEASHLLCQWRMVPTAGCLLIPGSSFALPKGQALLQAQTLQLIVLSVKSPCVLKCCTCTKNDM